MKARGKDHGKYKHGETHSGLHNSWQAMLNRCRNKNISRYYRYGGRGITVCAEWHDYITFRTWALSNGYEDGLTLDRINIDGNYEPSNCRWLTCSENSMARAQKIFDNRLNRTFLSAREAAAHHNIKPTYVNALASGCRNSPNYSFKYVK